MPGVVAVAAACGDEQACGECGGGFVVHFWRCPVSGRLGCGLRLCSGGDGCVTGGVSTEDGMHERWLNRLTTAGSEMRKWTFDDAKARFGELPDACLAEGTQIMIKLNTEATVLVSMQKRRTMSAAERPSLKELLLSYQTRIDLILPARGLAKRRDIEPVQ